MNIKVKTLLKDINESLVWYKVNLGDKKKKFSANLQKMLISDLKGVYFIRSNAPIEVLKTVGNPTVDIDNHKNIPNIVSKNMKLLQWGYIIKQHENEKYVVYNGKNKNLLNRIVAHLGCPKGNGCLALEQYDVLKNYEWEVAFYVEKDEMKRTLIEQAWRGLFGWPILCEE